MYEVRRIAGAFRTGDWSYTYGGDGKYTWLATAKRIGINAAGEGGFRCPIGGSKQLATRPICS